MGFIHDAINDNSLITEDNISKSLAEHELVRNHFIKAGVFDKWFEPIYEEPELPELHGYKGKIVNGVVIYGCQRFKIESVKELQKQMKKFGLPSVEVNGNYTVTKEQIDQIIKYSESCL